MKETTISVPTGTFPASQGDKVRISLTKVRGLDVIDALVVSITTGCGVADKVRLRYDESLLPYGVKQILACNVTGFQKLCDCCYARPCFEVFAPTESVENETRYVTTLPSDFRLDQVKFYSPTPQQIPIKVQVAIDGYDLFTYPLAMDDGSLTVNRMGFDSTFDSGLVSALSVVELTVTEAPGEFYYQDPWQGLWICLVGQWLPHDISPNKHLRTVPVRNPPSDGVVVVDGEGNVVIDGAGNVVVES